MTRQHPCHSFTPWVSGTLLASFLSPGMAPCSQSLIKTLSGWEGVGQCQRTRACVRVSSLLPRPEVQVEGGWEGVWRLSPTLSLSLPPGPGRFVTPDQKYSMDNAPHTPTPFKNALEKYGPLKPLVCGMGRSLRVVSWVRPAICSSQSPPRSHWVLPAALGSCSYPNFTNGETEAGLLISSSDLS